MEPGRGSGVTPGSIDPPGRDRIWHPFAPGKFRIESPAAILARRTIPSAGGPAQAAGAASATGRRAAIADTVAADTVATDTVATDTVAADPSPAIGRLAAAPAAPDETSIPIATRNLSLHERSLHAERGQG